MVAVPAISDGSRIHSGSSPTPAVSQLRMKNSGGVISSLERTELSTSPRLLSLTIQYVDSSSPTRLSSKLRIRKASPRSVSPATT